MNFKQKLSEALISSNKLFNIEFYVAEVEYENEWFDGEKRRSYTYERLTPLQNLKTIISKSDLSYLFFKESPEFENPLDNMENSGEISDFRMEIGVTLPKTDGATASVLLIWFETGIVIDATANHYRTGLENPGVDSQRFSELTGKSIGKQLTQDEFATVIYNHFKKRYEL